MIKEGQSRNIIYPTRVNIVQILVPNRGSVQIKILKVRKFLIFTTKIFLLLKLNLNYIDVRWFIFKYNVPVIDMNNILLYVVHSLSLKNQLD